MKKTIKIERELSTKIFEEPKVKAAFKDIDYRALLRANEEALKLVKQLGIYPYQKHVFPYPEVNSKFYENLKEFILNEALEMTFEGKNEFDLIKNIVSLSNDDTIEIALKGDPLLDAIAEIVKQWDEIGPIKTIIYCNRIATLRVDARKNEISRKNDIALKDRFKELNDKKGKNFCGECGCTCTCDKSCMGDINKCTSTKALEKGCRHCCDCYLGPLITKMRAEKDITNKD